MAQGSVRVIIGYIFGDIWDNGKENGNYYNGLYRGYGVYIFRDIWDNGKENGNSYITYGGYVGAT